MFYSHLHIFACIVSPTEKSFPFVGYSNIKVNKLSLISSVHQNPFKQHLCIHVWKHCLFKPTLNSSNSIQSPVQAATVFQDMVSNHRQHTIISETRFIKTWIDIKFNYSPTVFKIKVSIYKSQNDLIKCNVNRR